MKTIYSFLTTRRDEVTRSYVRIPAIMLALLLLSAGMVQAQSGNLEPPSTAFSGDNPQATTQSQPSWDQILPTIPMERFVLVIESAGVLDRETGLVWQKGPSAGGSTGVTWRDARFECTALEDGGRKGWRLPSVHELASLIDLNGDQSPLPRLPENHLFDGIKSSFYWSATTVIPEINASAWIVNFSNGDVVNNIKASNTIFVWCVRGGLGHGSAY